MNYSGAKELFSELELNITEEQFGKFELYKNELIEYNKKVNLTSITDEEEIWVKHFIDSCSIAKYIRNEDKMIDVGTGAGFPGIPVKILINNDLTLLDSLNKRIVFLEDLSRKLNFKNVKCVHGRAEIFAHDINYREKYDVVTARAVANLSTLAEYCLPFVKVGGNFICMKGSNFEEELENADKALKELGGTVEKVEKLNLPKIKDNRTIIIIRKVAKTKLEYPRREGIPLKNPL